MIAFFPETYPDELLYSVIARYHQRTGNARFVFTAEDIYQNGKVVHPSIEFVNRFKEASMAWLTKKQPWEQVVEYHTMFPAYVRFLPLNRRKKAVDGVISCNGNWKNLMCLPVTAEKRFLRFCPLCAKEDRETFGETYWHREHQISRIRVCPKHKTFLENSKIPISSKTSPGLFDAQSNVPQDMSPTYCRNQREIDFTEYVLEVFKKPINLEVDYTVGIFLNSRLHSNYKNKSKIIRNMTRLYEDYLKYYDDMPTMSETYMQKIFNGNIFDAYYILQLAYFEGISVFDISHLPPTENVYDTLFETLAKNHHLDYSIVADIGIAIINYSKVSNKSGPKKVEYEKLDEELFPKVKCIVDKMMNKEGRPEKISLTKVQRLLQLPQKQLNNLPKCKEYIKRHTEPQQIYWARQVEWAIREIERNNETVTLSKIMSKTNIRKDNIKSCIVYLDNTLRGQVVSCLCAEVYSSPRQYHT